MKATFFKGVALGAVVSSLTLVATAAVAGTGVGAVFNLGRTNTVNGSTALTGSTNGQQLRVVNTNAGGSAAGIGISTPGNKPPLVVNSTTKVGHLNVDLLDGLDSSALQRRVTKQCGNGTAVRTVNADGSVACTTSAVYPIVHGLSVGAHASDTFGPSGLVFDASCISLSLVELNFTNAGASVGNLKSEYSTNGSDTSTILDSGDIPVSFNRGVSVDATELSGQFIWTTTTAAFPVFTNYVVTINIHQTNTQTGCLFSGTAVLASNTFRVKI
jgi:hypothetical protein